MQYSKRTTVAVPDCLMIVASSFEREQRMSKLHLLEDGTIIAPP